MLAQEVLMYMTGDRGQALLDGALIQGVYAARADAQTPNAAVDKTINTTDGCIGGYIQYSDFLPD